MTEPTRDLTIIPVPEDIRAAIDLVADRASSLVVSDSSSYEGAGQARRELATVETRLKADFQTRKRPILDATKAIQDEHNALLKVLSEADRAIKQSMQTWQAAENARIAKLQQEAAAKADRERLRLEQRADRAAGEGDIAKAAVLEERAAEVQAPFIPRVGQAAGISERDVWKFRIVKEEDIPREYMSPNLIMIGGVVRASKDKTNIPGVEAFREATDVRKRY